MKLTEIANKINGTLVGADMEINGVVTDSRKVRGGSLFVAIRGERVDGHDFIPDLDKKTDCAYLTTKKIEGIKNPCIITDDAVKALGKIANLHLSGLSAKRVAVTGSVGKTTTKNYIAAALSECMQINCTKGNFNNELGLPLTALETKDSDRAVVLEMGMRGKGQITYLCDIAKPDVAVITNVGICHIELLGSRENILDAKWEIVDALGEDGIAVLNADDEMLATKKANCKTLTFGIYSGKADVRAVNIDGSSFDLVFEGETYPVTLSMLGEHNIYNALCAFAVGCALGCDKQKLIRGICAFAGDGNRQNIYDFNGVTFFDDTYNASPASMNASMSVFEALKGDKTLVLADMLELGDLAEKSHRELAGAVIRTGAKRVICVGRLMKNLYDALGDVEKYSVETGADALPILLKTIKKGDCVFFKGSNSMNLAKLVNDFKGELKNDN